MKIKFLALLNKKIPLNLNIPIRQISSIKTVLGIETSCDDTAVGIVNTNRELLAESKYNQWIVHKKQGHAKSKQNSSTSWPGGVIPDLARKLHRENLVHAVSDCVEKLDNGWADIDAIALTTKPGLEPCLWEGIKFTKLLLNKYKIPFIPIHHMEAHALTSRLFDKNVKYPFLTLLISGGHCLIALAESFNTFYRLGESIDISPGNCIDKISRQLGLYEISKYDCSSGGALVEKFALNGDPSNFPILVNLTQNYCRKNKDCNFSYTGLLASTHRLIDKLIQTDYQYVQVDAIEKKFLTEKTLSDLCASVQYAICLQLEDRLKRSLIFLRDYKGISIENVVLSGGVASNMFIRNSLEKLIVNFGLKMSNPPVSYCTDNGVMISWNGCEKLIFESNDIVLPKDQDEKFFESLKPIGKCEFGSDLTEQLKVSNIKVK